MASLRITCQSRSLLQTFRNCFCQRVNRHNSNFIIRPIHLKEAATMTIGQVDGDVRFTSEDCKCFYSLDRNGFFIATSESGQIAGSVAAPRLTENEGFVGFINVQDDFKSEGLEEKLWTTAMEYLKGCNNIGMEVQEDEVQYCEELGFKEHWRNGIFKGVGVQLYENVHSNNVLRNTKDMPFSQIVYYDSSIVGYERPLFLQKWTKLEHPSSSLAIYEGSDIIGYGVLRPLHQSNTYRIGPLYCNNVAIAQVLILSLLNDIPQKTAYITTPLSNPSFVQLIEKDLRMQQVDETVRMYTSAERLLPTHKMFGILSSDIG